MKNVLRHHLRPETRVATLRASGRKKTKVSRLVSRKQKINVAGQGQPKHLNIQPHGQYHALKNAAGHFAIYVSWLLAWRHISSLHSVDEPQEGRNSCPLLRSCYIGSCHIGVSKRFSRSISLAVHRLSSHFFWLIRSFIDPTLAALIVCGPLQFLVCLWFCRTRQDLCQVAQ